MNSALSLRNSSSSSSSISSSNVAAVDGDVGRPNLGGGAENTALLQLLGHGAGRVQPKYTTSPASRLASQSFELGTEQRHKRRCSHHYHHHSSTASSATPGPDLLHKEDPSREYLATPASNQDFSQWDTSFLDLTPLSPLSTGSTYLNMGAPNGYDKMSRATPHDVQQQHSCCNRACGVHWERRGGSGSV